jgi:predicted ATPase
VRPDLPTGTVTFLFTDVEGSTKLLHEVGPERYADALAEHRRILREAFQEHGGIEVDTQGDAFFYAFPTAPGALAAAEDALQGLTETPISVRVGIHTGTPLLAEEGYVGHDVHKAARIAAAGHGGQILVSSATAALVGSEDLSDLGEHRLKDLSAPERIHQLGDEEFPPLKSLYQTNLPIPATPFLGRERELQEVVELLARENNRLLTLTGPGGSGKTRLALQSAGWAAERYPHGVFWVPLAPLRDPELVLESASLALGASDGLADFITNKRLLLLFDNFEHLLEAASGLSSVLSSCPHLDLLVTSREPLHVAGEQEYAVPPLVHEEAVGFFASRARAVDPEFRPEQAVSEICRRLDDLPLALELAAARVKALTPQQILERLEQRLPLLTGGTRDAPERQRTLRATIEWSYELLSPAEQVLFARLAVFRGGCTLEAAEEVPGADLDTLQSLVDKSLVRHRDGRYSMLETIREYAAEQLQQSGESEAFARRHAEFFLALAEEAEPHLLADSEEWVARLEGDHDNVRAAFDELERAGAGELLLRLTGALWRFWYLHSHFSEGERRVESALATAPGESVTRAKALNAASVMALNLGEHAAAFTRAEQALELYRRSGDRWGAAYSEMLAGSALGEQRDYEAAVPRLEESIREFRELGDDHFTGVALTNLSWIVGDLGDKKRERSLQEEVLELSRTLGIRGLEAYSLSQLGMLERDEGRPADGVPLVQEGIRIMSELGDRLNLAINLGRLANLLALTGQSRRAAQLLASSQHLTEELGVREPFWASERNEKTRAMVREQLGDASFAQAWNEGRRLSADRAVALALERPSSAERDEPGLVES